MLSFPTFEKFKAIAVSKIDKWYFRLNPSVIKSQITFKDLKESLLQSGLISKKWDSDLNKFVFSGQNETPWRVDFNVDNQVSTIWYNTNSSFEIDEVNFCGARYSDLIPILNRHFEDITPEVRNMGNEWSYEGSDILVIICRDFFVTLVGLLKTSPHVKDKNNF